MIDKNIGRVFRRLEGFPGFCMYMVVIKNDSGNNYSFIGIKESGQIIYRTRGLLLPLEGFIKGFFEEIP